MNDAAVPTATRLNRRSFLLASAGLAVAVGFARVRGARAQEASRIAPNAWIVIDSKGYVNIVSPAAEMGQGAMTALPALVAEDLDADWRSVRVVQAPSDPRRYGNPRLGGLMLTGGSRTLQGYYELLRLAGAHARFVLLRAVANEWAVPTDELMTDSGAVVHRPTNRHIGYGEIAKFATVPSSLRPLGAADLKPLNKCNFIGRKLERLDIPAKLNGTAKFGIDTQVRDLHFGAVLRAPIAGPGMEPGAIDDAAARNVPGVTAIVPLSYGVGIVATTVEATIKSRAALKVDWRGAPKAGQYDSDKVLAEFAAVAEDIGKAGVTFHASGDAAAAIAAAAKTVSATYLNDHVYHATMEPMNATAVVEHDRAELWVPTQSPSWAMAAVAEALQLRTEQVSIHTTYLGGGFGRRSEWDFVVDAALLARAAGKPVKVIWTREDDVTHDKYRPLVAQHLTAGLDAGGAVVGWRHRIVSDSITARIFPKQFRPDANDGSVSEGAVSTYDVGDQLQQWVRQDRGIDVGYWRAVGPGYTRFAAESFVDEVAKAKNVDPLAFRLSLLRDERARNVIETAANMAVWHKPHDERALGLAYSAGWETHVATVAEVSLDRESGQIRVHRVWAAVDAGIAVQPQIVEAQIEGAVVHGTGQALFERISLQGGRVEQSNFHDYRVIRMAEAPEVHVQVLQSAHPPGGIGEVGLPPVAPAIANAVARLAGVRLRHLPMTPERVKAALRA
ncbi:MAG TPA: molybdopterin cofactor-binding domain-containing protein [Candidatus Cybelea sp.]|nr:molybdopterin cofactor-binding domain-containing protein [Candidatus Cybelea sp.]